MIVKSCVISSRHAKGGYALPITSSELYNSEHVLVRHVQANAYTNEIKSLKTNSNNNFVATLEY